MSNMGKASRSALERYLSNAEFYLDWWSGYALAYMDIWDGLYDDIILPNIVFPANFLAGATVTRVVGLFAYSMRRDTSHALNYLTPAGQGIKIKKSTGAWEVDDTFIWVNVNQEAYTPADSVLGGNAWVGIIDVSAVVDDLNGVTYNIRSLAADDTGLTAQGEALFFHDFRTGLRVFYKLN